MAIGNQCLLRVAWRKDSHPSLRNPPEQGCCKGKSEQKYVCNLSLCVTFPTHGTLESLMRKMPNYAFDICHIELQSLGCKLINVGDSKHGTRCVTNSLILHGSTAASALRRFKLILYFKCRDSGINGNLLLLMNRLQIAINHVRFCPSGSTWIVPFS